MSLRLKVALLITAGIAAATAGAVAVFATLQVRELKLEEAESRRQWLSSIAGMAAEAQLAGDPLMLIDYLRRVNREQPGIRRFQLRTARGWEEVGGGDDGPADELIQEEIAPAGKASGVPYSVRVWFSRAVFQERMKKNLRELLRNMGYTATVMILGGLVLSIPLSRTMTRRIVLIEEALRAIGNGKLDARLPSLGSDEVGRLAREVNATAEQLAELDRLKKTFVASVTHELRSPLGAIESYVRELLAQEGGGLAQKDRDNLARVLKNAERLGHFVTNLLEMAKVERGKLDYTPKSADLAQLVEDAVLFFAPKAKEAGLTLEFQAQPALPMMRLDHDLITHVLTNLLSNALKFTRPGGRVVVTVRRQNGSVETAVQDTGVGIGPEDLKRIFAPFERVKNPLRATGVGLGLSISKSIVEMHGGTITAESVPGKGSRFAFVLPLKTT